MKVRGDKKGKKGKEEWREMELRRSKSWKEGKGTR